MTNFLNIEGFTDNTYYNILFIYFFSMIIYFFSVVSMSKHPKLVKISFLPFIGMSEIYNDSFWIFIFFFLISLPLIKKIWEKKESIKLFFFQWSPLFILCLLIYIIIFLLVFFLTYTYEKEHLIKIIQRFLKIIPFFYLPWLILNFTFSLYFFLLNFFSKESLNVFSSFFIKIIILFKKNYILDFFAMYYRFQFTYKFTPLLNNVTNMLSIILLVSYSFCFKLLLNFFFLKAVSIDSFTLCLFFCCIFLGSMGLLYRSLGNFCLKLFSFYVLMKETTNPIFIFMIEDQEPPQGHIKDNSPKSSKNFFFFPKFTRSFSLPPDMPANNWVKAGVIGTFFLVAVGGAAAYYSSIQAAAAVESARAATESARAATESARAATREADINAVQAGLMTPEEYHKKYSKS